MMPRHLVRQCLLGLGRSGPVAHGETVHLEGEPIRPDALNGGRLCRVVFPGELGAVLACVTLEIERRGQRLPVSLQGQIAMDGIVWWSVLARDRVLEGDRFHVEGVNVGPEPQSFNGALVLELTLAADVEAPTAKRGRR